MSSFKQDATDFDVSLVPQIERGKWSRRRILDLLGEPAGQEIYPLVKQAGDTALIYHMMEFKDEKTVEKRLDVLISPQGLVRDYQYSVKELPLKIPQLKFF